MAEVEYCDYVTSEKKKRKYTEEQRQAKKDADKKRAKTRVNLGRAFNRWRRLRERKGFKTDAELALFFLNRYNESGPSISTTSKSRKEKRRLTPPSAHSCNVGSLSPSGLRRSSGKNIKNLLNADKQGTSEESTGKIWNVKVEKKRKSCFEKTEEPQRNNPVKISVGIMRMESGVLKPVRGMVLPLSVKPHTNAEQLLKAAVQKMRDFSKNLPCGPYLLLYPDGTKITNIPGTDTPFSLEHYKKAIGKAYQRITVYICRAVDFPANFQQFSSDSSDSEMIMTSRSTAEFSSDDSEIFHSDSEGSQGRSRDAMETTCYCKCTQSYASIIVKIEEDSGSNAGSHDFSKDAE